MEQIKPIDQASLSKCLSVIRTSFATVADEFGLTEQNAPLNPTFLKVETLRQRLKEGYLMYGLYESEQLVGYVSISKIDENYCMLHNLAVLPEHRHKGYGKQLLDFCKVKVKQLNGNKIIIDIIEENTVLKNWYLQNGFVHLYSKKIGHLPFTIGFMEMQI